MSNFSHEEYLAHHGVKGQKWGVRRYQNTDGTLTAEGRAKKQEKGDKKLNKVEKRRARKMRGITAKAILFQTGNVAIHAIPATAAFAYGVPVASAVIAAHGVKKARDIHIAARKSKIKVNNEYLYDKTNIEKKYGG